MVRDLSASSQHSNLCAPVGWSEWSECDGPCGADGLSSRHRTKIDCREDEQGRICSKICSSIDMNSKDLLLVDEFENETSKSDEAEVEAAERETSGHEDGVYVPGQPDRNYFEEDIQYELDELKDMGYDFENSFVGRAESVGTSVSNGKDADEANSADDGMGAQWEHYNEYNHDPDGSIDNGFMPHDQALNSKMVTEHYVSNSVKMVTEHYVSNSVELSDEQIDVAYYNENSSNDFGDEEVDNGFDYEQGAPKIENYYTEEEVFTLNTEAPPLKPGGILNMLGTSNDLRRDLEPDKDNEFLKEEKLTEDEEIVLVAMLEDKLQFRESLDDMEILKLSNELYLEDLKDEKLESLQTRYAEPIYKLETR